MLLCVLQFSLPALGWNRAGHERIARLAWARLDAATRATVTTLLEAHPAVALWKRDGAVTAEQIFQRAAVWPDDIRDKRPDNPYHAGPGDLHPEWHYIDIEVTFDGTLLRKTPLPNVVTALEENRRILRDRSRSPAARAVALSWVIHLMGDIHQPLHCAERFSQALPAGDLGGNRWAVQEADGPVMPLHAWWDNLGSLDVTDGSRVTDLRFEDIARQSFVLARSAAYDSGRVAGAPLLDPHQPPSHVPPLASDYVTGARGVARQQMWRGAVRLAGILREALGD